MNDKETVPAEEPGTAIIDVSGEPLQPNPEKQEVAIIGEQSQMLAMIERMATKKNVDMDVLERFIKLRREEEDRVYEREFNVAMSKCQGAMGVVLKNAENTHTHSVYANLEAIIPVIKPVYTDHGFALSFGIADSPPGWVRVTCEVSHIAGFSKRSHYDLPVDDKGVKGGEAKTVVHGISSSTTYGRRILTTLIFNVAVAGMDDDGNAGGGSEGHYSKKKFQPEQQAPVFITEEQVMSLETVLKDNKIPVEKFCKSAGIDTLNHLVAQRFDMAMTHIEKKVQQRNEK